MTPFKFNQYIQYKTPQSGSWGYFVKGYDIIDGKLYLISGDANIKHNIDDIEDKYKNYILNLINNNNNE